MSNEEKSFKENLDLLIRLFKKLKDKTPLTEIPGIDKNMYQNFDFFLRNYEMMKDQISDDLLLNFGEPMKKMIADLVQQLQAELGEDETDIQNENESNFPDLKRSMAQIDELLKSPALTEEQIDQLLDERARLKNENKE